jgi:N-acetyl-anhydromuramyl-L-alanine amidase AmpD
MPLNKEFVGCASSNFRSGRPAPNRPEAIVIHIMAGSLRGTDLWFGNPASSVSAHYGVGKDGTVHQYVREEDTAFHAGTVDRPLWTSIKKTAAGTFVNPNYYTIGIEHEGFPDDDWTAAMQASSVALIAEIAARWQIPIDRDHIVRHHEIRLAKPCPGSKAPMDDLVRLASAAPVAPPALTQVTAISNLNVRAGVPSTAAPVRRVVTAGTVLPVAGFTATGQVVANNPFWYQDPAGDYFWAGNTNRPNPAT